MRLDTMVTPRVQFLREGETERARETLRPSNAVSVMDARTLDGRQAVYMSALAKLQQLFVI